MQTFLPYKSFQQSAKCLDYRRLGKQRVEAMQILKIHAGLTDSKAWINHPATKMWGGYECSLAIYGLNICHEWKARGYKDTLFGFFFTYLSNFYTEDDIMNNYLIEFDIAYKPHWLGNKTFHASHRSALLFKNYDYYKQFGWKEEPKYDYVWPV
jgi:hypothetical protein